MHTTNNTGLAGSKLGLQRIQVKMIDLDLMIDLNLMSKTDLDLMMDLDLMLVGFFSLQICAQVQYLHSKQASSSVGNHDHN